MLKTILFLFLATASITAQSNYIYTIDCYEQGEDIIITYDLASIQSTQYYIITMACKIGNLSVQPAMSNLSGDIGNVFSGGARRITWHARKELGEFNGMITVTLNADLYGSPSISSEYTENNSGLNIVMKKIPGGTFTMGSNDSEAGADETPHKVTVSGFYMAKTEVTLGQFKAFIDDTGTKTDAENEGYSWRYDTAWVKMQGVNWRHDCTGTLRPSNEYNHPVIHVSWNDAVAYCAWLSRKSGKTYRLPTEAEWEYAAGNGSRHTKYSWGDGDPSGKNGGNVTDESKRPEDGRVWSIKFTGYNDGYWYTAPVGSYNANDFGLQDMTGNVWEWCADYCNYTDGKVVTDTYYDGLTDPLCRTGSYRVYRGGSWGSNPQYCRVAHRYCGAPSFRISIVGFRLVSPQ